VSEHSETLVELDMEYRHLAGKTGVPSFHRVPAVGTHPAFINALAALVRAAPEQGLCSQSGGRLCPNPCVRCAQA
ncbi:MAG: ferrochelatase, partial [Rhodospirillales bacterium]|nr:ferrochelatase [Rhodospirillales bacterium]